MKIAIIGAGNGGQSMAAHLTLLGHEIWVYDVNEKLISALSERGGIQAEGVLEGFAPIKASLTLREVVKGAEVIMCTTTANAHSSVAESLVPYLEDGQIILIFPGYWGALEFQECFKRNNLNGKVLVGETESLIYTCRSTAPGFVNIRKIKEELEFAAFPASGAKTIKERLKSVYPQLIPVDSVIRTTLNNVNPLFHVPILLLNAGRIESRGDFFFYPEGGTPSVVNLIEQIDQERLALGEALNIKLSTTLELLKRFYKVDADNLYDGFQRNKAYQTGKAPDTLQYRYIYEDVPYGLVPMVELGNRLGVKMEGMNSLINIASYMVEKDLRSSVLNLNKLGLDELNKNDLIEILQ